MRLQNASGIAERSGGLFKTAEGWCAVILNGKGEVERLILPISKDKAAREIKELRSSAEVKKIAGMVQAFFRGRTIDFLAVPVDLSGRTSFSKRVYAELRNTGRGEILTYRELAGRIHSPRAARAVGTALARNPAPLIIPCHRVVRSDGGMGGFTAPGGTALKQKMLSLEREKAGRPG